MREKKEINIKIGEQVKTAREKAGLTQEQLAEKIDVSPQYISDLERGIVGISVGKLKISVLFWKSAATKFFSEAAKAEIRQLFLKKSAPFRKTTCLFFRIS